MRIRPATAGLAIALCPFSLEKAQGVNIQFDYTYDSGSFFSPGSDARDRLVDAGAFFESVIADDFDAIVPSSGNSWSINFSHPSLAIPPPTISNPSIPSDTIVVYVGAQNLGGSTLGQAGPGGFGATGSAAWIDTILQRGEVGATRGAGASDYAPWGGSLSMNSTSTWDYSIDDSTIGAGENHFYSVLLHELAHILGVGFQPTSYISSWEAQTTGTEFTGAASVAEYGGNVPLQASAAHIIADTDPVTPGDQVVTSNIVGTNTLQEVAMDPNIIVGTVKLWTDLDNALLSDIGWEIVPIPEPSTTALGLLGVLGFVTRRRR